mmetsp:Transcript_94190/g.186737  ORF Transcript_94190/g.186737 Transcript_94190/m.186737 type:complete len:241 (+) Transcript_94190:2021-2743(+)
MVYPVPKPFVFSLAKKFGNGKIAARDMPGSTAVDIAEEDVCTSLNENLHDWDVTSMASQMEWSPQVRATPEVQVKGSGTGTNTAAFGFALRRLMRARTLQAVAVSSVDVAQDKAYAAQLPSPSSKVQRSPLVAVHHVAVSVVPQEDLSNCACPFTTLVKDRHEHVQRSVAICICLVHVSTAMNQEQYHVRIEIDSGHVQRRTKEAPTSVDVNANSDKGCGNVGMLFSDCYKQWGIPLTIK